eukprot:UN25812
MRAIQCGCPFILKPSERNPAYSNFMAKIIPQYLDSRVCRVVTGDYTVGKALMAHKFGLVYFVGSTAIGKKIAAAAGATMTPCVLECGGINPAIVDKTANLTTFASRIALSAQLNMGQLCIRPQYVLCVGDNVYDTFSKNMIAHTKNTLRKVNLWIKNILT